MVAHFVESILDLHLLFRKAKGIQRLADVRDGLQGKHERSDLISFIWSEVIYKAIKNIKMGCDIFLAEFNFSTRASNALQLLLNDL